MNLTELMKDAHDCAKSKGWWDTPRSYGDQNSNFHAELSEAWEEYRVHGMDPEKFIYFKPENPGKPEGIAVELVDLLIRVFDTAAFYNMPIEEALQAKMAYNRTRPHRHGGKVC